jgi:hypothetical protein
MADTGSSSSTTTSPDEPAATIPPKSGLPVRRVVWGVLSLAFVAFLFLGSVDARIWKIVGFGSLARWELQVESKSIARIWRIQGQSLPDVSSQWMLQALFYGSIVIFVAGVILGMHLLLQEAADETVPAVDDRA